MGVPITFLNKYNPEQFEIIGLAAGNIRGLAGIISKTGKDGPYINGKLRYGRIFIKRKL
nr:adenine-specific methyltransferase EcoRI family protein [Christensenella minuta]